MCDRLVPAVGMGTIGPPNGGAGARAVVLGKEAAIAKIGTQSSVF